MLKAYNSSEKLAFSYRVIHFFFFYLMKIFYRLEVYGQEHVFKGAGIIAANHVSFLDPPVLGVLWPQEVHFLARQSLFKVPLLGWFIKKINSHPLKGNGGDVAVFKIVLQLLDEGKKVILFPEGQRSYDNKLCPIKPGLSLLISKTNAQVIPTYIFGTFEAWPRTKKYPKIGRKIGCVFGSPFGWSEFAHLEKKQAQEAFAKKITHSLESLKHWYESGAKGTPP